MCVNCRTLTEHRCTCGRRIKASGYCELGHHVIFADEHVQFTGDKHVSYARPKDVLGPAQQGIEPEPEQPFEFGGIVPAPSFIKLSPEQLERFKRMGDALKNLLTPEALALLDTTTSVYLTGESAATINADWEPTGWWRVTAPDGATWAEASDEGDVRERMREGDTLYRQFEKSERRWIPVQPLPPEQTGDYCELPAPLADDAPSWQCDACYRFSWSGLEPDTPCGMTQPDGDICTGVLRPVMRPQEPIRQPVPMNPVPFHERDAVNGLRVRVLPGPRRLDSHLNGLIGTVVNKRRLPIADAEGRDYKVLPVFMDELIGCDSNIAFVSVERLEVLGQPNPERDADEPIAHIVRYLDDLLTPDGEPYEDAIGILKATLDAAIRARSGMSLQQFELLHGFRRFLKINS